MVLADEARGLAGRVLPVWRGTNRSVGGSPHPPAEGLVAHTRCTTHGAGCWLPVPPDWQLRGHAAHTYVAMLCVGGHAEYQIGSRTYPLWPGQLLLCPRNVWRTGWHDRRDPLQLYSVHFDARLYGVLDMPAVYHFPVAYRPAPATYRRMLAAAQRIVVEIGREEPGSILAADAACGELVALLWRETVRQGPPRTVATTGLARLAPVLRVIEERYADPLTLADLARAVHLGPAYFSGLFKRVVGVSPMRYLARYRLDRVRDLLVTTDLPIAVVAERTGFADAAYLSRVFRTAEGMPPREYRESQENPIAP